MKTEAFNPKEQVAEILRECLAEKMHKNGRYSARAFARDINVSPAFISMLLAGKKKLSLDRAQQIASALEMSERKRNNFLRTVALSSLPTRTSSQNIENLLFNRRDRQEIFPIETDQFKFFNNWYNIAILDLTGCDNFKSDVAWIANRLQLSPILVKDAVDRLIRLNLLKKENGKLKKTNDHISIPTHAPENTVRNFHQQMIDKAKENLNSQTQTDFKRRDISAITFSIDPRKVEEAKKLINDFKNQISDFLTEGKCTEVYQLNMQFFPLTKSGES